MTAHEGMTPGHGTQAASAWVRRWSHLVAPGGQVLDVACGRGRHAGWFRLSGHRVVMLDRDADALRAADLAFPGCEQVAADIENGPWPLPGRQFDAIVVTNYLWRPLFPVLLQSLALGGVLIYETFTEGHETVGRPSRPDFLLRTGELLDVCHELRIVAFEDGFEDGTDGSAARFVQRIAAVRQQALTPGLSGHAQAAEAGPRRFKLP